MTNQIGIKRVYCIQNLTTLSKYLVIHRCNFSLTLSQTSPGFYVSAVQVF